MVLLALLSTVSQPSSHNYYHHLDLTLLPCAFYFYSVQGLDRFNTVSYIRDAVGPLTPKLAAPTEEFQVPADTTQCTFAFARQETQACMHHDACIVVNHQGHTLYLVRDTSYNHLDTPHAENYETHYTSCKNRLRCVNCLHGAHTCVERIDRRPQPQECVWRHTLVSLAGTI